MDTDKKGGAFTAAWITLSDKGAAGEREDTSGPMIGQMLTEAGYEVLEGILVPDGIDPLQKELKRLADEVGINVVITTGGTGLSPRDMTPEATTEVCDRMVPGISEALRAYSCTKTPNGMLSRGVSGIRKNTLIINLPGSPKAVKECMEYMIKPMTHGLEMLLGRKAECATDPEVQKDHKD